MPFPTVDGYPKDTPEETLVGLRKAIVRVLLDNGIRRDWTHPLFHPDQLPAPKDDEEGCNTIFVTLLTAMFEKPEKRTEANIHAVLNDIATVVFQAFGNKIEVECFLQDLPSIGKVLLVPTLTTPQI